MSAEEENVPEETPAESETSKKPAAAKKRRAGAKKPAAVEEPAAEATAEVEQKPAAKAKAGARKASASKKTAGGAAGQEPETATDPAEQEGEPADQTAVTEPAAGERRPVRRKPGQPPRRRVVRAHARYVRTSARKARMVSGHLRGKTVPEARAILAFTPREVARDWSKLLESAVANAENNHELLEEDLVVREAYADEGPTIKRFRPRAMGRATPIHKRTSHLTITLTPGA
jgi:ribosomal protein L22